MPHIGMLEGPIFWQDPFTYATSHKQIYTVLTVIEGRDLNMDSKDKKKGRGVIWLFPGLASENQEGIFPVN